MMKLTQLQALTICNWFHTVLVTTKPQKIDAEEQFGVLALSINLEDHFKMELYRHLVDVEFNPKISLAIKAGKTTFAGDPQLTQLVNQVSSNCEIDWLLVAQELTLKIKPSGQIMTRVGDKAAWKVIFPAFAGEGTKAKDENEIKESVTAAKPREHFTALEDIDGQPSTLVQLQQEITGFEAKVSEHAKQLDGFTPPLLAIFETLQQEVTKCLQMKQEIAGQVQQLTTVKHQQKNQEKFISTICHEVRNPLNGIYGAVEALHDKVQAIEDIFNVNFEKFDKTTVFNLYESLNKLRKTASAIEECANHQKMIVDEVLDLSKLENSMP